MTTYKTLLQEVRTLKKVASGDFKKKLLSLLNSDDPSQVNQALSLNDTLGILSDQEIGDWSIPTVINRNRNVEEHWKTLDSLGWVLLKAIPNHPMWSSLTALGCYGGNITSLPSEIGNLTNLKTLFLNNNNLTSLPKEIGNLKNLETLYVEENNLTSIPSSIGNLNKLKFFRLSDNNLTSLPSSSGNLTKLRALTLDNNKLTIDDVPENLRKVTKI